MGKNLIQQARGKGSPTYRAPSFRYRADAKHIPVQKEPVSGEIIDIVTCQGHSAPLAQIKYENGMTCYTIAPEGIRVGDKVVIGQESPIAPGNTASLKNIPDGTLIYNIESNPGDGGKFCRAGGAFARVLTHIKGKVLVLLPSKKQRLFSEECRASIGIVAGSGRKEKPFMKAGKKHHYMKARNKLYPIVSGAAMNAVDHPFGTSRSLRKSKARPAPKNAPPGRKVGMIRPKRSGRKKK